MVTNEVKVFISYDKKDIQTATKLYYDLQQVGLKPWLDSLDILPGQNQEHEIKKSIRESEYFMLLLSSNSVTQRGTIQKQIKEALEVFKEFTPDKTYIVPIRLDDCNPPYEELEDLHPADIFPSYDKGIAKILSIFSLKQEENILKRVCFISSEYPPHVLGGLGVHVEQLTTSIGEYLDVDIILPSFKDGYQTINSSIEGKGWLMYPTSYEDGHQTLNSSHIHLQPMAGISASYDDPISWLHFAQFAIDKIRRIHRPDIIHCHDWVTILAGIKCRWTCKIPLIFHLHLPNRSPLCSSVENLGLICADLVTVNSESVYEEVLARSLPIRRLEIVKNGINTEVFKPCDNWPADEDYILFVGRLVEQKGVEYLLRAFSFVLEKFPYIRLKIIGDGPYRPWLERLSESLIISDNVEFAGWRKWRDLVSLYQKARIVVVPSVYEPFGMTALEGCACQRPIIASRVGGLKEIFEHGINAILTNPKDDLDLAQWLMALLAKPIFRNQIGERGRSLAIKEDYQWSSIAGQFISYYKNIINNPLDMNIPEKVKEFKEQITTVAIQLDPILGTKSNTLLNKLFEWM